MKILTSGGGLACEEDIPRSHFLPLLRGHIFQGKVALKTKMRINDDAISVILT